MERETKTLKCPSGKEVAIKTYLTGRESRAVRYATVKSEINVKDITEQDYFSVEDAMIAKSVVSYDGKAENIAERLQDENGDDYSFVIGEITKLIIKKKLSETKSDTSSTVSMESAEPI